MSRVWPKYLSFPDFGHGFQASRRLVPYCCWLTEFGLRTLQPQVAGFPDKAAGYQATGMSWTPNPERPST